MATKAAKINVNQIKTRDYAMVALINGATKSGAHIDRKKQASRKACRNYRGEW